MNEFLYYSKKGWITDLDREIDTIMDTVSLAEFQIIGLEFLELFDQF